MAGDGDKRALNHLRRLISLGHYPASSKLPSERALALELGVGRGALRRALAILEAEGQIRRHVGRGTFVGRHPAGGAEVTQRLSLGAGSPAELMELRLMVEPRAAALAAARATAEDIDYLRLCVEKCRGAVDWPSWERWDSAFHRTIAQAAYNGLLTVLVEDLNRLRRDGVWRRLREAAFVPDWQAAQAAEHGEIVDAIAARQALRAATALRRHIAGVEARLFGVSDDAIAGVQEDSAA